MLEELGITEDMASHAFVVKKGITLAWGQDRELWSVSFADAGPLTGPYDHAFQVVRSEFDSILLNNARRCGVTVLEEAPVVDFLFEQDRCCGLKYTLGQSGTPSTAHARFVVDASGQNALLARKYGLLEWDEALKNVAIWAYYQGGQTFGGDAAGFVDPLFSTGVFLALRGGRLTSTTVDRLLKEPERESEFLVRYEKSYRVSMW